MNEIPEKKQRKDKFLLTKFALMLLGIMLVFLVYSYKKSSFSIFGVEIKQNTFRAIFEPVNELIGYQLIRFDWGKHNEIDSTKQRILIAGDSMTGFLRLRLNDYCKKNGHTMYSVVWNSGNTVWYADTDTLDYFIEKFNPTYIIMVLGSNEVGLWQPQMRVKEIEKIIQKFGGRPFVWAGPPNWREDTGINDVILRCVGRKSFFPSKNLTYTRLQDGAHPDRKSAYNWMDSIAKFIMYKSKYPILLERPDTTYSGVPPTSVLSPLYAKKQQNTKPDEILNEMKLEEDTGKNKPSEHQND